MTAQPGASELQREAEAMKPGEWKVLETKGMSREFLETRGYNAANVSILQYGNKAQWDPVFEKFFFLGSPHDNPFKFIIYDAGSNSWSSGPLPNACMDVGHYHGGCWVHSYYYSAIDPSKGKFYFYFLNGIAEYDIAAQSWQQLPGVIDNDLAKYGGLSFFPEKNEFVFVAGQYGLFRYDLALKQWRFVDNFSMGDYHNISLYNPVKKLVLFGGGNNSRSLFRASSPDAPVQLGDAPRDVVVCSSIVTLDPVSGHFLVCYDDGAFYDFDAVNDTWSILPGLPSDLCNSIACNTGVIAAPIANYGVVMFVSYDPARVYLYKHAAGAANTLHAAAPTFDPDGGDFKSAVLVHMTTRTTDAQIFYTLDGSTPTSDDSLYSEPIRLNQSHTIKAIALKSGYEPSSVSSAEFNIQPDTVPPFLLSVVADISRQSLLVNFSEPVERQSAELISNYHVDQGVTVIQALLLQNERQVLLQMSGLFAGLSYTLAINNIHDQAFPPNTIAADTRFIFTVEHHIPGSLVAQYSFAEGTGTIVNDNGSVSPPAPLEIQNPVNVKWGNGFLQITGETILKTSDAGKIRIACQETNELSIEVWMRPGKDVQSGPARIVTFSQDAYHRNFTLGQTEEGIEVRLRTTTTDDNGLHDALAAPLSFSDDLVHIVYSRSANGRAALYIDSAKIVQKDVPDGDFDNWRDFVFALGDEIDGGRSWLGELYLVSIYSKALSAGEVVDKFNAGPFAEHEGESLNPLPSEYKLGQNFPNPFNDKTTIEFYLPFSEQVDIGIFSLDGRHVQTLQVGFLESGYHHLEWDGGENPSGFYWYQLATATESISKKMLFIK